MTRFLAFAFTLIAVAQPSSVEPVWKLIAAGKRPEAVAMLRELIKRDPRNGDARLLLGSVLMEDGQRESIDQLAEGVRLQPTSAEAHNALGEAYVAFDNPKAALPEFERAVKLNPRLAVAHVNLAAILVEQGQNQPAAVHLDQAIQLIGSNSEAAYPHYLRAKIYNGDRDAAKASSELEKAVSLSPDFAEAWSDLGETRKTLGDDDGSLKALRRSVELNPTGAVARTRLGTKLLDIGSAHEAVGHLEEAVRLDPKNQTALNSLLLALRRDGQPQRADVVKKQLAELIRERDRNDQNAVTALELNNNGAALEKTGDLRGALAKYRSALLLFPDHTGIRTNLAVVLLKLGRWDEGLAEFRETLRRDPNNAELKRALDDALEQYQKHRSMSLRPGGSPK